MEMNFPDRIQINKHEIIKERGKYFAQSLSGDDKKAVLSIVKKSEEYLKNVGEQDNVVYSPTKRELATFTVSFKRYVRTDFIEPSISRINKIEPEEETRKRLCDDCLSNAHIDNRELYLPDILCANCDKIYEYFFSVYSAQWDRAGVIEKEFDNARDRTIIPDELIGNWLLLMRKMREEKESKHIDNALKEFIRDELMNEFRKQNKQLIKKYGLWQNQ